MRLIGDPPYTYEKPPHLFPGAKIKFRHEKAPYTVQAVSERYTICTKPFNPQRTVLYTIIDWQKQVRGPENLIFGAPAETREECLEMLVRLLDGDSEVSVRRDMWLDLERVWHGDQVLHPRPEVRSTVAGS